MKLTKTSQVWEERSRASERVNEGGSPSKGRDGEEVESG